VKALDSDRCEVIIGSAMQLCPTLTGADLDEQRVIDEANRRRPAVIADAKKEYEDNRDVIEKRFPGCTLAKWIDSALQGEHLDKLADWERNGFGG